MTMRRPTFTEGHATAAAGFLSVTVECTLLFSLFLHCIRLGVPAQTLGLVMGACALLPYGVQKLSARVEGLLLTRIKAVWAGCLLAAIGLSFLLLTPLPQSQGGPMLLLCVASALCFLLFQLFETRLSMLCVDGRLQATQVNRYLQLAMTTGSALGGFLAGHLLEGLGLAGVGWVSALLLSIALGLVLRVRSSPQPRADGETPAEPASSRPQAPTRADLVASFAQLLLMCAAPAVLNFLLPWIVVQQNAWGPAAFGSLDFLAAFGAFVAILVFDRIDAAWLFRAGIACFLGASACLMFSGSFPHLAVMCLLWGLGMNLLRMRARHTFFLALRTERDALIWSQRLGVTRAAVEAVVPVLLGLFAAVQPGLQPGRLFAGVAWGLTAAALAVAVAAALFRRQENAASQEAIAMEGDRP